MLDGLTARELILRVLAELGTASRAEIADWAGVSSHDIQSALSKMVRPGKRTPKQVYICGWVNTDDAGVRCCPYGIYKLGDLPDARKPPPQTLAQKGATYRMRNRAQIIAKKRAAYAKRAKTDTLAAAANPFAQIVKALK